MSHFKIQEHTLTTSHIREYPHATAGHEDDELQLAIKQYTPFDNPNPQPGDVTIIGGHANGFPKVCCHVLCTRIDMIDNLLIVTRNCMSPYGTSYTKTSSPRV